MLPTLFTLGQLRPGKLSTMARPRGGDWLEDEVRGLRQAGVAVLVSLLTPGEVAEFDLGEEEAWCRVHGVRFHSVPIPDYGVPTSEKEVLALREALRHEIAEGRHVAIHCRQGIGRSSLVAAALLVVLGHDPEDAFARNAEARGRPVPDTEEQRAWIAAFATRRAST